jgi:hypothetical protein
MTSRHHRSNEKHGDRHCLFSVGKRPSLSSQSSSSSLLPLREAIPFSRSFKGQGTAQLRVVQGVSIKPSAPLQALSSCSLNKPNHFPSTRLPLSNFPFSRRTPQTASRSPVVHPHTPSIPSPAPCSSRRPRRRPQFPLRPHRLISFPPSLSPGQWWLFHTGTAQ